MKKHLFIIVLALLFGTAMQAQNIQVNINPEDAGIVEGAGPYSPGDTAVLIATANTGYTFLNWTESDTLVSSNDTLTFIITEDNRTLFANYIKNLTPSLFGNNQVCSNEEAVYRVEDAENAIFLWMVSDSIPVGTGNPYKMVWDVNSGVQQLSVVVTDTLTECTVTLEMEVEVTSHITSAETLVERVKDDVTYLLIYPNPESLPYKYQWYYNNEPIACDKQYLYKPISEEGLAPGTYKVYVSFNENESGSLICGAFSPEFVVNPSHNSKLSVYPNPTHPNGAITVINEDLEEASFFIYSTDGRLMHCQSIVGYQTTVHLDLPKGIYIAHLKSHQNSKIGRIVIE